MAPPDRHPRGPAPAADLPLAVQATLLAPLYTRAATLLVAHICTVGLCLIVMWRIGGPWPDAFVAASLAAMAARTVLFLRVRRAPMVTTQDVMRWRRPYQAVSLAWSIISTLTGVFCLIGETDEVCRLLAFVLMLGVSSAIASRNAGSPRFAIVLLCIWLVPVVLVAPLMGAWYWSLSLMTGLYLFALCSIVRQHYDNLVALTGAEHRNNALARMFDAAVSNMTQGLLMFGAGGTLQLASRRFCELFELPEDALQSGLDYPAFVSVCEGAGVPGILIGAFGAQEPGAANRVVLDVPDGRAFAITRRLLADGGRVVTVENVTGGRRARLALAAREAQLQAIFDNAGAGVVEVDIESNRLVRVNRVFCEILGRSEAYLLAHPDPAELAHAEDRPAHDRGIAALCQTGVSYDAEARYVRGDGTIVWARSSASIAAVDGAGRPTRLVAIVQDITERKAAEAALRASEEMLRLALEAGRIGVYRRDHITGLLHCGSETKRMHGFSADTEPVPAEAWLSILVPEDRAKLAVDMRLTYAERRPAVEYEYRYNHPTEGIRHVETRSSIEYDEAGRPTESIGVMIDVTDRRAAEARIAHLAHHDSLTDLPNRSLFHIRLDEALARARRGEAFALFCLDLDHFKFVNDTLGHPVGDALLKAVTQRLQILVRPTDTVARLGGDEFAILQSDLEQAADATALAGRIIAAIAAPFDIEGHHIVIGISVGVSLAPADGMDADQLLRNADMALYAAKAADRGCLRFFEPEMDMLMQARRALELDLRRALDTKAFELFYQPVIAVSDGTLRGLEALLRWRHPTRGLVAPDRFIPLAEAVGLIVPIGEWVLHHACAAAAAWPGAPRVAVNVSAVQFGSKTLVDNVAAALRESGLDPERLELEITETALLQDTEANLETLHRLRALGVRIAMDDFGTGYSSLSYLLRFPFTKVKIDRAFIANLGHARESSAIVGAVIGLCTSLNMSTSAEGVESASQLAELARIGCSEAQGHFVSPACPADEIPAVIERLARPREARVLMGAEEGRK